MMAKYIHIGYPKNFSTTLQRAYFSKHPEICHLGIGIKNNLGYKDSIVEKTFEVYLKTTKEYKYREVKKNVISHFQDLFEKNKGKYKMIGASSEHLSFAFTHDSIDSVEKANRIYEIFGGETKIVIIIRNQFDLIKSLYRECVRVGFQGDFEYFFKLFYKYQDRNSVYDFRYDLVFETYSSLFGEENVGVFFFEDFRGFDGKPIMGSNGFKLYEKLNQFLGLDNYPMEIEHFNASIPFDKILLKVDLNKLNPHDLGNHLMESAEKHRIKTYLEEDLGLVEYEKETYSDVLTKRALIEKVSLSKTTTSIKYEVDKDIEKRLEEFYLLGNLELQKRIDRKLPEKYFNLKL